MYIVYCSVYCDHFGVLIGCCVSKLHAKLCLHHNVWPEIVSCCFNIVYQIVLTQFTRTFIMIIVVCSLKSIHVLVVV